MSRIAPQRPPYRKSDISRSDERKFRGTACEACGIDNGTVVGAHLNIGMVGRGWKVPGAVAGLCDSCHSLADGRVRAPIEERMKVWLRVCQKLLIERTRRERT